MTSFKVRKHIMRVPLFFEMIKKNSKSKILATPLATRPRNFAPTSQLIQIVCPRGFARFATHPNSFAPPPLNSKNKK